MKGVVLVELLEMAESLLGEEVVDEVLAELPLSTGGAYVSVGRYPCSELMALVQAFSARSGIAADALQKRFGEWMHGHFVAGYPNFYAGKPDALAMLEAIEGEVHAEVLKLYPDAELPRFDSARSADGRGLTLTYRSPRPLGDFCHGLVEACIAHFGDKAAVTRTDRPAPGESIVEFQIRLID